MARTVREIVAAWLKKEEYDGLCHPDAWCACEISDLMPCVDDLSANCEAGYKIPCDPETCELDGDCPFHIAPERPKQGKGD